MGMENNNIGVSREFRELNNERILYKKVLESQQEKIAEQLKGEMGQDIKDVLSGKKVVKLSFLELARYKIRYWVNRIFDVL